MSSKQYDYAIVGAGAAGLQLAAKMAKDSFFDEKKILIIEKEEKNTNDRTWSFWEVGETSWDHVATKTWKEGLFISDQKIHLNLDPYRYKTIRSLDFYAHCKAIIQNKPNITWIRDEVTNVKRGSIQGESKSYQSHYIFDSRINPAFFETRNQYDELIQHFKGWVIETPDPVFDPSIFTMMDYRLQWKNHTSFTYVLPFSPTKALVEFTLFDQALLTDQQYNDMLNQYIHQYLKIDVFDIKEVEKGQIPMSTYPFHKDHQTGISKIGTAGGWVRPSSGYSFKNADNATSKIIANIKKGKIPHANIHSRRHWFYDLIFLNVLVEHNAIGVDIFFTFYQKHTVQRILRFLDQESSFVEDLLVINSLNRKEFRQALSSVFKRE